MANLKADAQLLRLLVEQQDGEYFVVNDATYQLGYALERGLEVERGIDRVGHFQQERFQPFRRNALCLRDSHCAYDTSRHSRRYAEVNRAYKRGLATRRAQQIGRAH